MTKLLTSMPEPVADLAQLTEVVRALKRNVELMAGVVQGTRPQTKSLTNQNYIQSTEPTALNTGDLWVNTGDNNKLYVWSGTTWMIVTT